MPAKLSEAAREEREAKKKLTEERKAKRRAYLVPDLPEAEFVKQSRARVYRMKQLTELMFDEFDPEYELYKEAERIENRLRAASTRLDDARVRQAAAGMTGNVELVNEEDENFRKHYKDFIYYRHVIGVLYAEFMEEVGSYGSI